MEQRVRSRFMSIMLKRFATCHANLNANSWVNGIVKTENFRIYWSFVFCTKTLTLTRVYFFWVVGSKLCDIIETNCVVFHQNGLEKTAIWTGKQNKQPTSERRFRVVNVIFPNEHKQDNYNSNKSLTWTSRKTFCVANLFVFIFAPLNAAFAVIYHHTKWNGWWDTKNEIESTKNMEFLWHFANHKMHCTLFLHQCVSIVREIKP